MSQQPIGIIGAGLGGLTLARSLAKRGIPAVLYDRGSAAPKHSYGITLHPWAYRPLLSVLELDEKTFRQRVAVDTAVGGSGIIDSRLMVNSGHVGASSFRANRWKLESLLQEGLDVKWDHALERIEHGLTGPILHMKNGQRIEQKAVVGTDGVHSATRKSLLPDSEPTILPFVAFNGKRRIQRDVFDTLYSPALKDTNILEAKQGGNTLQVSINDNTQELVSISWIYSRAAHGSHDPLYMPNRPLSGATDTPEEFYQEIGALKDLSQPFADIFDVQKLRGERILSWLMRTVDLPLTDLKLLAAKNVFLVGDSAHAQPILGGEGANAAILDGIELTQHLALGNTDTMVEWYAARYEQWKDGVEQSKRSIEAMHVQDKAAL